MQSLTRSKFPMRTISIFIYDMHGCHLPSALIAYYVALLEVIIGRCADMGTTY